MDNAVLITQLRMAAHQPHFSLSDFRVTGAVLDVAVNSRRDTVRVKIGLPGSSESDPWLYAESVDEADWVSQLLLWIAEEVETGGLTASRDREIVDGWSYVSVQPYGWRRASMAEHLRLLNAAERTVE